MSRNPGYNYQGSLNLPNGTSGSYQFQKESGPTFPYGCKWGCGRENVCSQPGNSCGRAGCNEAYKNRSLKEKVGKYFWKYVKKNAIYKK